MSEKYELIFLKFISYNKFSFKLKKIISKKIKKLFLLFWLLKKQKSIISISFRGLKSYKKTFVILKSPKCYKVGKMLVKYQYYKYVIIIKKKVLFLKNLNSIQKYFKYYSFLFKFFDTNYVLNSNIKYITHVKISFKNMK